MIWKSQKLACGYEYNFRLCGLFSASGAINISVNNRFNTANQINNYYIVEQESMWSFKRLLLNREQKNKGKIETGPAIWLLLEYCVRRRLLLKNGYRPNERKSKAIFAWDGLKTTMFPNLSMRRKRESDDERTASTL